MFQNWYCFISLKSNYVILLYQIEIYQDTNQLPIQWDNFAQKNFFLHKKYLKVLEQSAPINMQCFFIGFFENNQLMGIALSQSLNFKQFESFGYRDSCTKTKLRNFAIRNFSANTLLIGNNMATGQNCFSFDETVNNYTISTLLVQASLKIKDLFKKQNIQISSTTFKDFNDNEIPQLQQNDLVNSFVFKVQPNMVLNLNSTWKNIEDYQLALLKKYKDQYKRARKKAENVVKIELNLEEIKKLETVIYQLYLTVAQNSPFNTFLLHPKHFSIFKEECEDNFKVYGYFFQNKLVGFYTLIINGNTLEPYFLGYNEALQKENMLYLNMLYDMVAFGTKNGFAKIVFGRTALEIKSSIGAIPQEMSGFILHHNKIIQYFAKPIFNIFQPKIGWQKRNPFK